MFRLATKGECIFIVTENLAMVKNLVLLDMLMRYIATIL